jgi:hypothetical protein
MERLVTRRRAGELDAAAFDEARNGLMIQDDAGQHWVPNEDGSWYCYDGSQWEVREPPVSVGQPMQARLTPAPSSGGAEAAPAREPRRRRWLWGAVVLALMLVVMVCVGGYALLGPTLQRSELLSAWEEAGLLTETTPLAAVAATATVPSPTATPGGPTVGETPSGEDLYAFIEEVLSNDEGRAEQIDAHDRDGDGSDDEYVLQLPREELTEDLVLDRQVAYARAGESGLSGTLTLGFENTGDSEVAYEHVEEIPKELAGHIDELTFSVPPDEIIDPDPKAKWAMKLAKSAGHELVVSFKKGDWDTAQQSMQKLAASYRVLGCYQDWRRATKSLMSFDEAYEQHTTEWQHCLYRAVLDYRDQVPGEYLSQLACGDLEEGDEKAQCQAVATRDRRYCEEAKEGLKSLGFTGPETCRAAMALADCRKLDNREQDECLMERAKRYDALFACTRIEKDDLKVLCLAEVSRDLALCASIDDPATLARCCRMTKDAVERKQCCDQIEDDELSERCLRGEDLTLDIVARGKLDETVLREDRFLGEEEILQNEMELRYREEGGPLEGWFRATVKYPDFDCPKMYWEWKYDLHLSEGTYDAEAGTFTGRGRLILYGDGVEHEWTGEETVCQPRTWTAADPAQSYEATLDAALVEGGKIIGKFEVAVAGNRRAEFGEFTLEVQ